MPATTAPPVITSAAFAQPAPTAVSSSVTPRAAGATPPPARFVLAPPPGFVQSELGSARVAYAKYLNGMHNRIHPIFNQFLSSLESLPKTHALNDQSRSVVLAIVLASDGSIVRADVASPSGATAFDVAAVDSVHRAAPFARPPAETLSEDGNLYMAWAFYRDEVFACSTAGARPFRFDAKAVP